MSFRLKQRFAAVAFRLHLLLHRVLDLRGRYDVFQFDAVDLDTPFVGRLVKNFGHFAVDRVSGSQRSVKFEFADDVTQGRRREIFERGNRVDGAVSVKFRVKYAEIYDRVDLHRYVIFGYNGLRRRVEDLLFERHALRYPLKKRDLDMNARRPCGLVFSEKFNDVFRRLRNDLDVRENYDDNDRGNRDTDNYSRCHVEKPLFIFNISKLCI